MWRRTAATTDDLGAAVSHDTRVVGHQFRRACVHDSIFFPTRTPQFALATSSCPGEVLPAIAPMPRLLRQRQRRSKAQPQRVVQRSPYPNRRA